MYDKLIEWEVNSFCRPHFPISALFTAALSLRSLKAETSHTSDRWKSLYFIAVWHFTSQKKFLPLLLFPFSLSSPSHKHTHEPVSSPLVHLPGKTEPQTTTTQANSVIWIKWRREEGSRGTEEWWVPGREQGRRRRRRGSMVKGGMRALMWIFSDSLKSPLSWPSLCWEPRLLEVCRVRQGGEEEI